MPPLTLKMHSTNSNQMHYESNVHKYTSTNQDLQCWNVHTCTSNSSKYLQITPIKHLCTSKLQMASKTQSSSKALQNSSKAPKAPPKPSKRQTCTSNTHKPSRSLSVHTSNQTFNHATRMCRPITYWKLQRLYASNATIIKL